MGIPSIDLFRLVLKQDQISPAVCTHSNCDSEPSPPFRVIGVAAAGDDAVNSWYGV